MIWICRSEADTDNDIVTLLQCNISYILLNSISDELHCIRSVVKYIKLLLVSMYCFLYNVLCMWNVISSERGRFMLLINIYQWYRKKAMAFSHFSLNSVIQMGKGNIMWDMVSKALYFKPCERMCPLNTLFFALPKMYSAWVGIHYFLYCSSWSFPIFIKQNRNTNQIIIHVVTYLPSFLDGDKNAIFSGHFPAHAAG